MMTIEDVIKQHLDQLLVLKSKNSPLTLEVLIEIGAYVGGGVLRGRFSAQKEVLVEEVNGVFRIIGQFFHDHFGEDFTAAAFVKMKDRALVLMQDTSFDANLEAFMLNS